MKLKKNYKFKLKRDFNLVRMKNITKLIKTYNSHLKG